MVRVEVLIRRLGWQFGANGKEKCKNHQNDQTDGRNIRGDRIDENGTFRRIGLSIGRRVRQVLGQQASGRIDCSLNVTSDPIDVTAQIELHGDAGRAQAARRCHLSEARNGGNFCSSGVATEDAIVSGLAPGNAAVTLMVGKSTVGSAATGNN
jgi:hypothetical protein